MNDNDKIRDGLTEREVKALEFLADIARHHRGDLRPYTAQLVLESCVMGLEMFLGPERLKAAYGTIPEASDRRGHLNSLTDRLRMVEGLFRPADPNSSSGSLGAAAKEIEAIANGDEPRLFATLPKTAGSSERTNTYRLALHQLNALGWVERFKQHGLGPSQYQGRMIAAYGVTWDALRKWKPKVIERLGAERVARHLEFWRGPACPYRRCDTEELLGAMERDGKRYVAETFRRTAA